MIKLIDILNDVITELSSNNIQKVGGVLTELLNPDNAYEYHKKGNGWYQYTDDNEVTYDVRVTLQTIQPEDYLEFKTWWTDESGGTMYDNPPTKSTTTNSDRRSDTVAKIYRDEIVPFLATQPLSKILKIIPIDSRRYRLSIILVRKYTPSDWEIIENFPKEIIINIK
jgi:hypothetical protein